MTTPPTHVGDRTGLLARVQGPVAVAVPWLAAVVLAPGADLWLVVSLVVPVVYALTHARAWVAWAAPVSGVVSVLPTVPAWASGGIALAVGAVLAWRPPAALAWGEPRVRWSLVAGLGVLAVAVASVAMISVGREDAAFEASQEQAARAWQTFEPEDESVSPPADTDVLAEVDTALVAEPLEIQEEAAEPIAPPFAKLRFAKRDGTRPVIARPLYVGPDVSERGLAAGPGHYPSTARPGRPGNIAIAGHRYGWGSPFLHLDELQPGDRIRVVDRKRVRHTYVVDSSILVEPDENWVLGPDPLGTGEPTLTLTTCDPPRVNTKRLIVFATLAKSVPLPEPTA